LKVGTHIEYTAIERKALWLGDSSRVRRRENKKREKKVLGCGPSFLGERHKRKAAEGREKSVGQRENREEAERDTCSNRREKNQKKKTEAEEEHVVSFAAAAWPPAYASSSAATAAPDDCRCCIARGVREPPHSFFLAGLAQF